MLQQIEENELEELLYKYIIESTKEEFPAVLSYIIDIEHSYGRIDNEADHTHCIIPVESLKKIEIECHKKIKQFNTDDSLLDNIKFYEIRTFWNYLNKKEFDDYMIQCLKKDINVPKYLSTTVSTWSSSHDTGWSFNESYYNEYLTSDNIYTKLQRLKGTKLFNTLNDNQKQVSIAFSIWYETKDENNQMKVSQKNVDKLANEWVL